MSGIDLLNGDARVLTVPRTEREGVIHHEKPWPVKSQEESRKDGDGMVSHPAASRMLEQGQRGSRVGREETERVINKATEAYHLGRRAEEHADQSHVGTGKYEIAPSRLLQEQEVEGMQHDKSTEP